MRTGEVFAVQAELLTLRSSAIPEGAVVSTLRMGRASTSQTFLNTSKTNVIELGVVLQLNVDNAALGNQRCTITLAKEDKSILGIALISLSKEIGETTGTYKLNQSPDKKAELNVRIRVRSAEQSYSGVGSGSINPESKASIAPSIKKEVQEQIGSLYKFKSAGLEYKMEDEGLAVLESELERLKKEKEVYYQLYQIQKAKSEMAAKVISSFISKISGDYPELMKQLGEPANLLEKGKKEMNFKKQEEALKQLEQANRSLHRQVEEYKKINQQLKNELCKTSKSKPNGHVTPSNGIEDLFPSSKSCIKGRNSNILSPLKSELAQSTPNSSPFVEVDLKKWLQQSVGQRQSLQKLLKSIPKQVYSPPNGVQLNLPRVRAAINKSYVSLISKGVFSRQSIMSHKRQINSIFEELLIG